jgi:hypothetical protein
MRYAATPARRRLVVLRPTAAAVSPNADQPRRWRPDDVQRTYLGNPI